MASSSTWTPLTPGCPTHRALNLAEVIVRLTPHLPALVARANSGQRLLDLQGCAALLQPFSTEACMYQARVGRSLILLRNRSWWPHGTAKEESGGDFRHSLRRNLEVGVLAVEGEHPSDAKK